MKVLGDFKVKDRNIHVELSLVEFDEDNVKIIYSPAFDLSGYGNTLAEAKESFNIALAEFIRYTENKKTITQILKNLGWSMKGSKSKPKFTPPKDSDLISKNPTYNDIVNNKSYSVSRQEVALC